MTRSALASLAFVALRSSRLLRPPDIEFNDNLAPAGRMVRGVLVLDLEIRQGTWHPLGAGKPSISVPAFAEAGKPLQNPGPMIRVRLGTPIRARVTNRSETTLAVRGLSSRRAPHGFDAARARGIGRGALHRRRRGKFLLLGGMPGSGMAGPNRTRRWYEDSQLNGAFIVDPGARHRSPEGPGSGGRSLDRGRDSAGLPLLNDQLYVINGRPWPHTERMTYTMGDSVRWRVINASPDVHPFHLHGFYFRVDARGDMARDTLYWPPSSGWW